MAKNKKPLAVATLGTNAPSAAMIALFAQPAAAEKLTRRNLPQLVKPESVPVGGVVSGEILKVISQPDKTKKKQMFSLWLKHESGQEFLFPAGGVIRNALIPGVDRDDEAGIRAGLEKEIGNMFVAKRCDDKMSETFKKKMFVFDVYTGKI